MPDCRRPQQRQAQENNGVVAFVTSLHARLTLTRSVAREHFWCRYPDFHLGNTTSCRSVLLSILTTTRSVHGVVPVHLHSWSINQRIVIASVCAQDSAESGESLLRTPNDSSMSCSGHMERIKSNPSQCDTLLDDSTSTNSTKSSLVGPVCLSDVLPSPLALVVNMPSPGQPKSIIPGQLSCYPRAAARIGLNTPTQMPSRNTCSGDIFRVSGSTRPSQWRVARSPCPM